MKHTRRLLALLLAFLMVFGMFSAVAEMEVTLDAPQDIEVIDPDGIEGDLGLSDPDLEDLDLEGLDLEDPALVSEAPEAAAASNEDADAEESTDSPFQIDETGMLIKYTGDSGDVIIPDNVNAIWSKAFANNSTMYRVQIPASVTQIYDSAFLNCTNLTQVTVLAQEITIADNAFIGESPRFFTVVNSQAADFARQHGYEVESNLILLNQNYTLKTWPNRIYRIYVTDSNPVSYISSNPSVAKVNADGIVRTVNSGNAQISVTLDDGNTRLLTVYVNAPKASLSTSSMTLKVGDSQVITVRNLSGRTVTWSSSNANVASVNSGKVYAKAAGSCTITARLSDGTILTCKVTVYSPRKAASLNKTTLIMKVGDNHALIVNNLDGRTVTWSSSNTRVASVKSTGGSTARVTAKAGGSCTITAKLSDGTTLTCRVTVYYPDASLSKDALSMKVGDNRVLTVSNLAGRSVTWSSSNANVASVKSTSGNAARVTAKAAGSCTITARLSNGTTLNCRVTVIQKSQPKPQKKASLNKETLSMKVGDSEKLTVNNLGSRSVTWSSSNANVASVNGGRVTAKAAGSCTITAKLSDGTTLNCRVTVTPKSRPKPQPKASLNKTTLNLYVGQTGVLIVNNLSGRSVTWSSSNANIASVNGGKVYARGVGSCNVTARLSDGTTLNCRVNVSKKAQPKPQPKPSLNRSTLDLKVGDSFTLTVNNRGNRSVTWSSNASSVASVSGGKVTARKAGKCTITARLSDGTTLTCGVTVTQKSRPKPQPKASLNRSTLDLKVGDSFTLAVNNRGNRSVTWSSNYPSVASVSGGKVTARKAGRCTITARLSDGTTLTCRVKVSQKAQPKPSLNRTKYTLNVGRTFKLYVNNLGNLRITSWESSNTNIATIDRYGVITALRAGSCVITARLSNGTMLQCNLTVKR